MLAIPLIDTSFVVAKRIKHGRPVYLADRTHLHHRFQNIGFSQRRSVIYLYVWCATLALAAFATRFVPPARRTATGTCPESRSTRRSGCVALGASVYVVYLLEIVKLANPFIRRRLERRAARKRRARAPSDT